MMKNIKFILIFILLANTVSAEIYWDGRFYQHAFLLFNPKTEYSGVTILDLKFDTKPTDILRVRSEMEYSLFNNNDFFIKNNATDISINLLNAAIMPGDFKITIGRFLPDWGKGNIFRPLDIFKPQTYFLNMLSFQGIDGISIKYYISDLSSIQFITVPEMDVRNIIPDIKSLSRNTINHTLAGFNLEMHIATFDNNLIFVKDTSCGDNITGFAFKGDAIIGIWGEIFYSFDNKFKNDMLRYTLGGDYSFAKYFFITFEYFYDESGKSDYKKYFEIAYPPRMTFGKEYIMANFNILTYEELNYGITYIMNVMDKSFILFPYFRYEIIENATLGISLYHFNGKTNREFAPNNYGNYILNTYFNVRF